MLAVAAAIIVSRIFAVLFALLLFPDARAESAAAIWNRPGGCRRGSRLCFATSAFRGAFLFRGGDTLGARALEDFFRAADVFAVLRVDGDEHFAFLYVGFVPF